MTRKVILEFRGKFHFLSNFYLCKITVDGFEFDSVEHAYQAMKTPKKDWPKFVGITPGQAKRLGRKLKIRDDWEQVKLPFMKALIMRKFMIPELREKLLNTGDAELIEGNSWGDIYWGVCDGQGQNNLGKTIMEVREQVRT